MEGIDEFYDPELYNLELGEADDTATTIAFYSSAVGEKPLRVLDIGTGAGRVAIPLLQRGHSVVCVDSSHKMLAALETELNRRELLNRATFLHQPFGSRHNQECVDVAIAPDDFLLHLLTEASLSHFFSDLKSWLSSGGRFITDTRPRSSSFLESSSSPPFLTRNYGLAPVPEGTNATAFYQTNVWEVYRKSDRQIQTIYRYEVIDHSGRVTSVFYRRLNQRLHTNKEITNAAKISGFRVAKLSERNAESKPPSHEVGATFQFLLE